MSSGNDGEWVRQGTPRDADWDDEQSEYGTAVSPTEWNDYTSEQSVQVTPPAARSRAEDLLEAHPPRAEHEGEDEPTTRVVLSDPQATHALDEAEHPEDTTVLKPMPAPQGVESAAPARAAHAEPTPASPGTPEAPTRSAASRTPVAPTPIDPETPAVARRMPQAPPVMAPAPIEAEPTVPEPAPQEPVVSDAEEPQPPAAQPPVHEDVAEEPAPRSTVEVEDEATATQEVPLFQDAPLADQDPAAKEPTAEVEPVAEERVRPRPIVTDPDEPTSAMPAGVFRDGAEAPTEVIAEPVPEPTAVVPAEELDAERRLEEQIAAERAARNERLGVVASSGRDEVRAPQAAPTRVTDKFLPSLGLMFLRLVVAGILGLIGYQILTSPEATAERLATTVVPQPQLMTWVLGFTLGGIALFLVIGLMVRVAGLLMLVLAVGSLAFYRWGAFSPFLPGVEGFSGDRDLLLGAVGLLFVAIGGGGWGIDGAFRRGRARAKEGRSS